MTNNFINKLKSDFAFLNISDELFEQVINKCADKKKSDDENKKKVYRVFYNIIHDNIVETGEYTYILDYIKMNFNLKNVENSIDSLNKLVPFLGECRIDITKENYDILINNSQELKKCLEIIIKSNEINKKQKFDLLDEKAIDLIEFFTEDSNSLLEESFSLEDEDKEILEEVDDKQLDYSTFSNSAINAYLNDIRRIPLLTKEEEYELTKKYKETHDKTIRDRIIKSNLRYVVSIAYKMSQKYTVISFNDLISAGNEGLMRALDTYDPDKARFTTYAGTWILQKMRREVQSNFANIRVPVHKQEKISIYFKKKDELEKELGREATLSEIKEYLGYSEEKINEYENNISKTVSLNTRVLDDKEGTELLEFIADSDDIIPEEIIIKKDQGYIEMLFENLTEIEKMVIKLRAGLYDGDEYTLEQTAIMLYKLGLKDRALTRERVRQLEKKAVRKITKNKQKFEHSAQLLGHNKKNAFVEQPITINDVIMLIKNTNKDIMSNALSGLCNSYKVILKECFGDNILDANLQHPTNQMIKYLLTAVYPKLLSCVIRIKKIDEINKIILPINIFNVDERYTKEEVEIQIDQLEPFERLILNKFYDIYTGDLHDIRNITQYEKEQIIKVISKIKIGLIRYRTPRNIKKSNVSKNKLFEYFRIENKDLVIFIIESLPKKDIEFLQSWYGENYDIDPRINGQLYNKMDKKRRDLIFNKIKIRLDRFILLKERNTDITIEQFVKSKRINNCSKDNIYAYFEYEGYSEEEITLSISQLSDNEKELLKEYYGSDLKHPKINLDMPEESKKKVLLNMFKKIQRKLYDNKTQKVLKKEYKNN